LIEPLSFLNGHFIHRRKLIGLTLIIAALFPLGCAIIQRPVPQDTLTIHEAESLILRFKDQQERVSSFFASGTVLLKGWIWKSEADILIAGTRDPYKIKIEITHPWGSPIFHLLIEERRVEAISFSEKTLYLGDLSSGVLSKFLPEILLDRDLIWSVLRGFPFVEEYHRAESQRKNVIHLLNQKGGDVEVIELSTENLLPEAVIYPERSLNLAFSGFLEKNGIYHAEEVTVNNIGGAKDLVLKIKNMVLNESIPDQIFTTEKPSTFETVYMN
jgi:hypothetical protein